MKTFELKRRASDKKALMASMVSKVETEDRDWTPEEQEAFDKLAGEVEGLKARIEKQETAGPDDETEQNDEDEEKEKNARKRPVAIESRRAPAVHSKRHSFSVVKAIRSVLDGKQLDGLEGEVNKEMALQTGKSARSFYVPHDFGRSFEQRASVNIATTGLGAIPTIVKDDLIEYLYNRAEVIKAGARVITDMVNKFALPSQTGTATAQWVGEGAAPAISNQTITQVVYTPKTIAAYTDATRKFIMQSVVNAEEMIRHDLEQQIALGIDYAALNGNPSNNPNQPLGIFQNPAVPSVTLLGANSGAPTYNALVDLETLVSKGNADMGALRYMTSAVGRGTLKVTARNPNGYPVYLMENGEANGYPVSCTNQIPDNFTQGTGTNLSGLCFGNWNDLVIALFGPLDILVDPFTGSNTGTVRINVFQDADIAPRHPASFASMLFAGSQ